MNDLLNIENKILVLRGQQVIFDRDLAELYGVETKVLNQAVKRNIERFPERFMFQLQKEEQDSVDIFLRSQNATLKNLKSQIVTSNWGGRRKPSYVFTEQGVDVTIYTRKANPIKKLDIDKFNAQYPTLTIKHTSTMHNRFLILDNTEIYHIGASIKDLGKKCFGFTQMEDAVVIINAIMQNL